VSDSDGVNSAKYRWDNSDAKNGGTSFSNGTVISSPASDGEHTLYLWAKDNLNNESTANFSPYQYDDNRPTVDSFTVNNNTTNFTTEDTSLDIAFSASDTGGSGLMEAEIWRQTDGGTWQKIETRNLSGNSDADSWTDNVTCGHNYAYGLHVKDNAANCTLENNQPCSGTGSPITAQVNCPAGPNNPPNNPSNLKQFDNTHELSEGETTSDDTPYFTFTISDPDSPETVGYQIQIDDSDSFNTPLIDYTWDGSSTNPNNVTYQVPSSLPDGSYFWRVRSKDDGGLYSPDWVTDNGVLFGGGGVDFKVDTIPEGPNQAPVANFTACRLSGNTIRFTDTSTDDGGIASRDWDFGDGSAHSALTNPEHNYDTGETAYLGGASRVAGVSTESIKTLKHENIKTKEQNQQSAISNQQSIFKSFIQSIKKVIDNIGGLLEKPVAEIISWLNLERAQAQGAWWNTSWLYRRKITFDNSASSENLVNFPVLIKLNSSRVNYGQTQNSGQDIRFIDADGSTVLAHEIEKWNESGDSFVWVKVPQINASSNTDYIYLYYGNASASDGQNKTAVWDSNFKMVWHLNDASGRLQDASTNNLDSTSEAGITYNASGQMSTGLSFNSGYDTSYARRTNNASLRQDPFTWELWFKAGSFPTNTWLTEMNGDQFSVKVKDGNKIETKHDSLTPNYTRSNNTTFSTNTWYYLVTAKYTSGNNRVKVYKNGSLLYEGGGTNKPSGTLSWGDWNFGYHNFGGTLDEIRVSSGTRSANWIAAQYKSMTDVYNTYGSEEPQPPVAPTNLNFTNVAQTSMTLNWTDNANNEQGYKIYRCQGTGCAKPGTPLTTLAANMTTYNDTGPLSCATTYQYWVEAYNAGGTAEVSGSQATTACSTFNVSLTVTDNGNPVLQDSETKVLDLVNMTLAGQAISDCPSDSYNLTDLSAYNCSLVGLTWTNSPTASSYKVIRRPAGGSWQEIASGRSCCSYDDNTVSGSTTYEYYLEAEPTGLRNSTTNPACSGGYAPSGTTCPLSVTTPGCTATNVTAQSTGCGVITISWNTVTGATGYDIYRGLTETGTYTVIKAGTTSTSYEDKEIIPQTTYYYKVKAKYSGGGESGFSNSASTYSYCYKAPTWVER
jgi:hypothetical protein